MSNKNYTFQVEHEYEGSRIKTMIKKGYVQNYMLPLWLEQYCRIGIDNLDHKAWSIQLLDCRYLRKDENKLSYLTQDTQEQNIQDIYQKNRQALWRGATKILNQKGSQMICQKDHILELVIFACSKQLSNEAIRKKYTDQNIEQKNQLLQYILVRNIKKKDLKSKNNDEVLLQELVVKDLIIPLWKKTNDQQYVIYQFETKFNKDEQQPKQPENVDKLNLEQFKQQLIGLNPQFIKKVKINFTITDKGLFLQKQFLIPKNIKINYENLKTKEILDQNKFKNEFCMKNKSYLFRNKREFLDKHYSLAFQGGGAKGIAYVGTYKAFKQHQNNSIPLKSIMGSSAGGITALAVLTGIPYNEAKRVCYTMAQIPLNDRFVISTEQEDRTKEQAQLKKIIQNIKIFLRQYGIMDTDLIDSLSQILQSSLFKQIQQKLIALLQMVNPTLADILKIQKIQKKSYIQAQWSWPFYKQVPYQKKIVQLNWHGLLLHGALMKGQSLHDTSAICLIKYFLKQNYQIKDYDSNLKDYFYHRVANFGKQSNTNFAIVLHESIKKYNKHWQNILKGPLKVKEQQRQRFLKFLVTIINKFLLILQTYSLNSYNQSVNLTQVFLKYLKIDNQIINTFQNKQFNDLVKELLGNNPQQTKQLNYQINLPQNSSLHQIFKQISLKRRYSRIKNQIVKYYRKFDANNLNKEQQIYLLKSKIQEYEPNVSQIKNNMNNATTYSQINALNQQYNLLNYRYFKLIKFPYQNKQGILGILNQIFQNITVNQINQKQQKIENISLMTKQFNYNQLDKNKNQDIFFHFIQLSEQIVKTCKQFDLNVQIADEQIILDSKTIIQNDQDYLKQLRDLVATITLKQYYDITKVQLTCTSVDLDHKILRLFNHKTSPDLPVCRSVQMTGSFPVAFKAQSWRRDWGYYYVHKKGFIIQQDIRGHEFTDGGLLANFPIKYLDNKEINQRYYTHMTDKNKTILLGFGLDYMDQSMYQLSADDLKQERQKNDLIAKAKADLMNSLSLSWKNLSGSANLIWNGFKLWYNADGSHVKNKLIKWGQIQSNILDQIPLIKFILKIIKGYPNADRAFNLEAFQENIFLREMPDINRLPINNFHLNGQIYHKYFEECQKLEQQSLKKISELYKANKANKITEIKGIYIADKQTYYQKLNQLQSDKKKQSYRWKILNSFRQFNLYKDNLNINKQLNEKGQNKNKQQFNHFLDIYNSKIFQREKKKIDWIKDGIFYTFEDSLTSEIKEHFQPSKITFHLIQILFNSLKMPKNKVLRQILTRKYIVYKYLTYKVLANQKIEEQDIKDSYKQLNKLNLYSLYLNKQYDEITKHLDFNQFKSDYYKDYLQQQKQAGFIKKDSRTYDYYVNRKIDINKQRQNQFQRKYIKNGIKQFNNDQDIDQYFTDPILFDIGQSINRFIEYLYFKVMIPSAQGKDLLIMNKSMKYLSRQQLLNNITYNDVLGYLRRLKNHGQKHPNNGKMVKIVFERPFADYFNVVINVKDDQRNDKNYEYYLKQLINCNIYPQAEYENYYKYFVHLYQNQNLTHQFKKIKMNYLFNTQFNSKCKDYIINNSQDYHKQALANLSWLTQYQNINKQGLKDYLYFLFNQPKDSLFKQETILEGLSSQQFLHLEQFRTKSRQYVLQYMYGQSLQKLIVKDKKSLSDKQFEWAIKIDVQRQKYRIKYQKVNKQNNKNNQPTNIQNILILTMNIETKSDLLQSRLLPFSGLIDPKSSKQKIVKTFQEHYLIYYRDYTFLSRKLKTIIFLLKNKKQQQQSHTKLLQIHLRIVSNFSKKLDHLLKLSANEIDQPSIDELFMIDYQQINCMANIFCQIIKKYGDSTQDQMVQQTIREITSINTYEFSIPLFKQDLRYLLSHILKVQPLQQILYQKIQSQVKNNKKQVHLVFEGVGYSNQKIHNYIYHLQQPYRRNQGSRDQKKKKPQEIQTQIQKEFKYSLNQLQYKKRFKYYEDKLDQQQAYDYVIPDDQNPIKFITASNFHSIFGLFYALGLSIQEIRSKMYHMKYLVSTMMDKQKIKTYFDKGLNPNCLSQYYSGLLSFLDTQYNTCVKDFTKKSSISSPYLKTDYYAQIQDLQDLYLQEKQYLVHNYSYIMNKMIDQYEDIKQNHVFSHIPVEISKKYALDFTTRSNNKIQYSKVSNESKQKYLKITQTLYLQYGKMLQAAIGNYINNNSIHNVTADNVESYTKGFISIRMMQTYKIKKLIFKQLIKANMSPSISLKTFSQQCKRKVFLNFTVTNVSEQRLQFLNSNTMPNMPIWAAIIASSRLPVYHTWLWGQRQWEHVQYENLMEEKLYKFFNNVQNDNRPCTFYNSGNYISSLPIQLLTNQVLIKQIYKQDNKKPKDILYIGLAFNQQDSSNLQYLQIPKNYLRSSTLKTLMSSKSSQAKSLLKNGQINSRYNHSYSAFEPILKALKEGPFFNVYEILINSNDNFIMKYYYNKLVKLPIKINTLNFKDVTNASIKEIYNVSVPSTKTNETVLRSYYIAKSFISNISMRVKNQGNIKKYLLDLLQSKNQQLQLQYKFFRRQQDQLLQQKKKIFQKLRRQQTEIDRKRFHVILRVECLNIPNKLTGFLKEHLKITALNHTKWNNNRYNNFVIEYAIFKGEDRPPISSFARSQNSEILWKAQNSSKIMIRFYYPYFGSASFTQDNNVIIREDHKQNKILYTEMVVDCKEIIANLPAKNSFDYEFAFAEDSEFSTKHSKFSLKLQNQDYSIGYETKIWLKPTMMNNFTISHKYMNNQQNNKFLDNLPSLVLELTNNNYKSLLQDKSLISNSIKTPSDFKFKKIVVSKL